MSVKVTIRPNGPYLVEGDIELLDVNGTRVDTSSRGPRIALQMADAGNQDAYGRGIDSATRLTGLAGARENIA